MAQVMKDVMIDIESLSVAPNATILTIGAIKFNRKGSLKSMEEYDSFYIRIDPQSCEDIGCHTDPDTVEWWQNQPSEAIYEALENPDRVSIKSALTKLSEWFGDVEYVWANSPSFDCVILESAYSLCNMEMPWKFWVNRDCRTLFDIANICKSDMPRNEKHHALYDCYRQIVGVKKALKKLKK